MLETFLLNISIIVNHHYIHNCMFMFWTNQWINILLSKYFQPITISFLLMSAWNISPSLTTHNPLAYLMLYFLHIDVQIHFDYTCLSQKSLLKILMIILFFLMIKIILLILVIVSTTYCLSTVISAIKTNVSSPIDAVILPNSSIIIANQNNLYLFHTKSKQIQPILLPIKAPIINLVLLQSYIAICSKQSIYLYYHNLTLKQTQNLSAFKQYSRIAVKQQSSQIFYIPFAQGSLQFQQSKLNSTIKHRFINENNLHSVQYFQGHQFILAIDQTGAAIIYNISSTNKIHYQQLCNSSITEIKRVNNCKSIIITCQNISFIITQNSSLFQIKSLPYVGYSFALVYQQYLFMINSTQFLLKNKQNIIIQKIQPISNIVYADMFFSTNLVIYVLDDNGTFLIIDITNEEDEQKSSNLTIWQITGIGFGGIVVFCIVGIIIKKKINRKMKKGVGYNRSEQSQLTLNLLQKDQYQ